MNDPARFENLSPDAQLRVDAVCDRYEAACRAGERPDPTAYLSDVPDAERPALGAEFARMAAEYREDPKQHSPDPPVAIPGYEILGELASGGMGVVYKARQLQLNRIVALKMALERADAKALSRFLAEVEAVAGIDHAHVVRVYESGHHAGQPYLVMEYMEKGTLADRLKACPEATGFEPRAAAELLAQVARGVAEAHAKGIIHRDLKPGNVLFDAAGVPKVADFGLAKRGTGSDLTATQAVMGTPDYMSPEQAGGRTKSVGVAADVWALGAILYECLTGRRPFAAKDVMDVLRRVRDDEPTRPRTLSPRVPQDLELICLMCLEKRPGERYATVQELIDDLGSYLGGKSISIRPPGMTERAVKWVRRNPTATATATVIVTVLISATAVSTWQWRLAAREADRATREAERADGEALAAKASEAKAIAESERAGQAERDAKRDRDLAESNARVARQAQQETEATWTKNFGGQGAASARVGDWPLAAVWYAEAAARSEAGSPDADRYQFRARAHLARTLTPVRAVRAPGLLEFACSPDGRFLLTVTDAGRCTVRDLETETALQVPGLPTGVSRACWDPAGRRLAVGTADGRVALIPFPAGVETESFRAVDRIASLTFSPDGRRLAVGGYGLQVWDVSGKPTLVADWPSAAPVRRVVFAAGGRRFPWSPQIVRTRRRRPCTPSRTGAARPGSCSARSTRRSGACGRAKWDRCRRTWRSPRATPSWSRPPDTSWSGGTPRPGRASRQTPRSAVPTKSSV